MRYIIYSKEQAFRHMTKLRSMEEQLLYIVVDEVLFNVWDALCLSMHREYREAYFPYLPHVFDILIETRDGQELFNYLIFIEEAKMGAVKGDTLARRRAWRTIDILLHYRTSLFERSGKSTGNPTVLNHF